MSHVHQPGCACCGVTPSGEPAVCFILPPHILKHIIREGAADVSERALRTLVLSADFAGRRKVLSILPAGLNSAGVRRRTIFDARGAETLPGTLVRGENDPKSTDVAVNEAFDYSGATYDFYKAVFGRNSVDDKGLRLDSTVHFGHDYDNAFWNGNQMVYGDGDNQLFNRFTISIDVVGHELTHGVTQYTAGLEYQDQSGALNESFSDVFGSMIKQYARKQTADKADWLIGQGLFKSTIQARGLRDMLNPGNAYADPNIGKDPQPANMKDYVKGSDDNGGVHINSGIPNRAFALAAKAVGGHSWERVGKIWYRTLTNRLAPDSTFADAAAATISVAAELFGATSPERKAVADAWHTVGVTKPKAPTKKPKPQPKLQKV